MYVGCKQFQFTWSGADFCRISLSMFLLSSPLLLQHSLLAVLCHSSVYSFILPSYSALFLQPFNRHVSICWESRGLNGALFFHIFCSIIIKPGMSMSVKACLQLLFYPARIGADVNELVDDTSPPLQLVVCWHSGTGRTARLPSLLLPKTSTPAMKPHLTTLEKYTMQTIEIGYAFKKNPENQYKIDALA